jgi:hypothetical protein
MLIYKLDIVKKGKIVYITICLTVLTATYLCICDQLCCINANMAFSDPTWYFSDTDIGTCLLHDYLLSECSDTKCPPGPWKEVDNAEQKEYIAHLSHWEIETTVK